MTTDAIEKTTQALKNRIEQAISPSKVHIGAPHRQHRNTKDVTLFLFHIEPNAELRNEQRFEAPPAEGPAERPSKQIDALPLDLRYLITVYRSGDDNTADAHELIKLGQIIQTLHAQPTLIGPQLRNQIVRLTPEPYPLEELSRVWALFPDVRYSTSMVYLATPVFVEVSDPSIAAPVLRRTQKSGVISETPDNQTQQAGGL